MNDQGGYENFYGNDVDPMADELETGRITPVDPEIGRRKDSLLV
jgi:hypothetical protein